MENIFEFFEEMDEFVYVSDPGNYELVYMNRKLRESLDFTSQNSYEGKKCYEVLRGTKSPCSFCTTPKLEKGQFLSWIYKNPIYNKRFLIKDSLIFYEGRQYRVEIAIDIDTEISCENPYYFARRETVLNECLQRMFITMDPEESMNHILSYIGKTFQCERTYLFEIDGDAVNNTYEWCKEGIVPQKNILQKIPKSNLDWWIELFKEKNLVTISNLEEIRLTHPASYAILKPQGVDSLVAGPVYEKNKLIGFVGADNPDSNTLHLLSSLLKVVGYFMVFLLKRRDLLNKLNMLSFHDSLTGAYNRNALYEHCRDVAEQNTLSVVYCDVTGLKHSNDTFGHKAGDQMLIHCYRLIRDALDTQWIYRMGGDEFAAVFKNLDQNELNKKVDNLRESIRQDKYHVAVGSAWSCSRPLNLDSVIISADKAMYMDKQSFYNSKFRILNSERNNMISYYSYDIGSSPFDQFLKNTYHDLELFFRSMSQQNRSSYFYFGDVQKDIYYISDNMRDEFGFHSNIVSGLLKEWGERISSQKAKEMYFLELEFMLREKRCIHDLRYQVKDVAGKIMWVHCYGILKWNEEKTVPLFFSGRITHQDNDFVVDPLTNFPRSSVMLRRLDELKIKEKIVPIIGFSFNNIAEVNNTRGRIFSDRLVKKIASDLMEKLSEKLSFYRMEGMRCAAIINDGYRESKDVLVRQIESIIDGWYKEMEISVQRPCSFAIIDYPRIGLAPSDLLEQMVSLLRIAKHDKKQKYEEYSEYNIRKVKTMSDMAMTLNHDVLNDMENFRIVVQPVVSSKTGNVIGGEALLRWDFRGEEISPEVFVPMLEKESIIIQAGRWVFEQAVCTCMRMISYNPEFYLTFNVSLQQIGDTYFAEFMEEILQKYQLNGHHLVAEITESYMDKEPEVLIKFVKKCSQMGIRIALDDFGSGYSSLRMLLKYPSSIIKLDRSILVEMTKSDEKLNFISSIVYACHRFGKDVCMEGVETADQDLLIRETGCDMLQGFYYYKPMEVEEVYTLLSRNISLHNNKKRRTHFDWIENDLKI